MWKENILEDLEVGEVEYESAGEFLYRIKKEVWRRGRRISKISRVKEAGARREDNGGICVGV